MPGLHLQLDDLCWKHGANRRALKPGRLTVEAGRTGVVLAHDAADAEAFSDVLLGQAWPVRGRILITGREITSLSPADRGIAFVPAGGGLFPHLTIEQNIEFGVRGRHREEFRKGQVNYVAERLNLRGLLGWRPHDLSLDERLRVALARAMCHWQAARAVLIEDRDGYPPCHAAVSESLKAYPDLPVLVVSDDRNRVETLRSPTASWEITGADGP
ncbi:ATP-binding cassette domain-containing protein [Streptosporangium sp. NBC_01639]|uniref:ATP-binding cassette domain-containing protein n=1 Tax=unclassified Streptosporangium TaxID=2632669 RepID=UPI002DD9BFBB|nr:ATP-binding cassette domain-containing protein [Streptosporangium sp. NBC_01756]WSC85816.1 ATP-binding cassette domain-containing protein [Streptosporangium sp. NBC_01756]WTD55514.1 ATP-binding cassette domain-containing protein [Streptosporangium sp. NBC_01639]